MANPMRDEHKLWEKIKREKITVHPLVWDLIDHHVRNNLNLVALAAQNLRMLPEGILEETSEVLRSLYKKHKQPGNPPPGLIKTCDDCMKGVNETKKFLIRLKEATLEEKPE